MPRLKDKQKDKPDCFGHRYNPKKDLCTKRCMHGPSGTDACQIEQNEMLNSFERKGI